MEIDLESIESQSIDVEVEEVDGSSFTTKGTEKALKRKRKLTSFVWRHFKMLPLGEDKKQRAKCIKCGSEYLADSKYGTGNLKRHLDTCLKTSYQDMGQILIAQESGAMALKGGKFNQEKFREMIISAMIMHDLPFNFVEYAGIRSVFHYLHPQLQLVSRNTAKADAFKLYKKEKSKIKSMLEDAPGRISFTSDAWTSLTSDGYVCLTAHFIDKNWSLQKRVLNFSFMPPPHSGVALSEKLNGLFCEWGVENKVFSVTLDNAAANAVSVDMLREQLNLKGVLLCNGDLFHMRCCAHVLNLIVQDGLKYIDDSITKIRDSVKYVKGSQVRKQKFLECVKLVSMGNKKGLCQDVPTRWNSTYLMLESAIHYRRAFQHLELSDSNYKHCPSSAEWEKVEKIKTFLKLFYDATISFSGTKYPTSNLFFPSIWQCCFHLKTLRESTSGSNVDFLRDMADQMWTKFQKYWSEFHLTLAIACVLDPRYKLQFVDFSYKKLYGSDCMECIRLKDKLFGLFKEYMAKKKPEDKTIASENPSYSDAHAKESEMLDIAADALFRVMSKFLFSGLCLTFHQLLCFIIRFLFFFLTLCSFSCFKYSYRNLMRFLLMSLVALAKKHN